MARRISSAVPKRIGAAERPSVVHSNLYLPDPIHEGLRRIVFDERVKIHDVVLEGVDLALRRRGHPSVNSIKVARVQNGGKFTRYFAKSILEAIGSSARSSSACGEIIEELIIQ